MKPIQLIIEGCYCFHQSIKKNNPMRFRIVDSDFVRICTNATQWAYIPEPESEVEK